MDTVNSSNHTMAVWDSETPPPTGYQIVVLWQSYASESNLETFSIPKLIEKKADILKDRILAWIYDLGERSIGEKRLVDWLEIRKDFSYWWMTIIAGKSYAESSRFYDIARLFILEELIQEIKPKQIIFQSSDKAVSQILAELCRKTGGIDYRWVKHKRPVRELSWPKYFYSLLPYIVQAGIYLGVYFKKIWRLKHQKKIWNLDKKSQVTCFNYLVNLDSINLKKGIFFSNYWTSIQKVFTQSNISVNWIHHFIPHETVPTASKANDILSQFSDNCSVIERHMNIEASVSFTLLLSVLRDYVYLIRKGIHLKKIRRNFQPVNSMLNLWPILKLDWKASMYGVKAISNCIQLNFFEAVLYRIPTQKLGIYLQENQAWEMALISIWRQAGHGDLIGVQHATVRDWDLRYFFDARIYLYQTKNNLPMPNQIAVNGPTALESYKKANYPNAVEVEALRYLYLSNVQNVRKKNLTAPYRLLICFDLLPHINEQMIEWLKIAATILPRDFDYIIKPHPANEVQTKNYLSIPAKISGAPLSRLLQDCDMVFVSNITSAAVDAYCFGLPVIQVLDGNVFNLSPLRCKKEVFFVSNGIELADAILQALKFSEGSHDPFFCLDTNLPRWQKLVDSKVINTNDSQ